jgi:hypothetical protein
MNEVERLIERGRFTPSRVRFVGFVGLAPVTGKAIIMHRTKVQLMSVENGGKPRHDPKAQQKEQYSQFWKMTFKIFS